MTESEFWNALEQVFGTALGHSLTSDLYLRKFGWTACEALANGVEPDDVWAALVEESGVDPHARWVHRQPGHPTR